MIYGIIAAVLMAFSFALLYFVGLWFNRKLRIRNTKKRLKTFIHEHRN